MNVNVRIVDGIILFENSWVPPTASPVNMVLQFDGTKWMLVDQGPTRHADEYAAVAAEDDRRQALCTRGRERVSLTDRRGSTGRGSSR